MSQDDAVPIVICNRRVRGPLAWLWMVGFCLAWAPVGVFLEQLTPREWNWAVVPSVLLIWLISLTTLVAWLLRHPRISRIKLTEEMRVYGVRRLMPAQIAALRLVPDPDEDYVDSKLPVPMGLIEIKRKRGISVRMVISVGDARRLQQWAERKGVAFDDPMLLLTDSGTGTDSDE